jgi:hypothetical protein
MEDMVMPRLLIRGSLLAVGLVLSLVGAAALLLTALNRSTAGVPS